jgi:DNA polymerase-4
VTLKVKYEDFIQITRSRTLHLPSDNFDEIFTAARSMLLDKTEAGERKIRLLGLSVSGLVVGQKA